MNNFNQLGVEPQTTADWFAWLKEQDEKRRTVYTTDFTELISLSRDERGIMLDYVLEIDVPDSAIVERMSGRRVHLASGRTYHLRFNPPKVEGRDDVTGEELIQRVDDLEETVTKRLEVYARQTRPLVEYYQRWAASGEPGAPAYRRISGLGSVEDISARALAALA